MALIELELSFYPTLLVSPIHALELVNDEDDVMLALAINLAKLIDHVGGSSKAMHLIGLLEELCVVEEGTVRKQAANSIC